MKKMWLRGVKRAAFVAALVVAGVLGTATAHATTILDDSNNYQTQAPERLSTYVVGSESTDIGKDFNHYKSYQIIHDGVDVVRPITLKKGAIQIAMFGSNAATGAATIYSDEQLTDEIGRLSLTTNCEMNANGSFTNSGTFMISKSKTYYIKFTNTTGTQAIFTFMSQQYDGSNRTLTTANTLSYIDTPNGATYYYVNVPSDGTITIKPKFYKNGYTNVEGMVTMTLTDSDKKPISVPKQIGTDEEAFSTKAVFGVKAGGYWIKVTAEEEQIFSMNCVQAAVSGDGASTLKSAKKIKSGKWYKGLCIWNNTTDYGEYFTFTLTKASKVSLSLKGNVTTGRINVTVTGTRANGSITRKIKTVGASSTYALKTTANSKLPAGTYYIKVSKDTKKTNGFYKIRCKITD